MNDIASHDIEQGAAPGAPKDATNAGVRVHYFESTADAYDQTQCDSDIRDGDVLVIAAEKVVGFLNEAWPVALTAEHGEFHTLIGPAGVAELDEGRYVESARIAAEEAREIGTATKPEHTPPPFTAGDRIRCTDGRVRTVTAVAVTRDGTVWVSTGGPRWKAERCRRLRADRAEDMRRIVLGTARQVRELPQSDTRWPIALDTMGRALQHLADVAPALARELLSAAQVVTVEIRRTDIATGDIIHAFGARLAVVDTGVETDVDGSVHRWFADVQGVTEADCAATYRGTWSLGLALDLASQDLVTVERAVPAQPH
ncbi:hypothetical protein OG216_19545 [Streptomycetaceae bacterium NBC_01309]